MAATCVLEDHKNSTYVKNNLLRFARLIAEQHDDTTVFDVAFKFNVNDLKKMKYETLRESVAKSSKISVPTLGKHYGTFIRSLEATPSIGNRQTQSAIQLYYRRILDIYKHLLRHLQVASSKILIVPLRYGDFETGRGHWFVFVVRNLTPRVYQLERYDSARKASYDVILESLFYEALQMYVDKHDPGGNIYTRSMDYKDDKHALQPVRQPDASSLYKDFFCQTWSLMFIHLVASGYSFDEIGRIVKKWPDPKTHDQFFIIRDYNQCWVTNDKSRRGKFNPDVCLGVLPIPARVSRTGRSVRSPSSRPSSRTPLAVTTRKSAVSKKRSRSNASSAPERTSVVKRRRR
jgi:hypothetical protein